MKYKYIVFDLFGTITNKRYVPVLFDWYLNGKRANPDLIDVDFTDQIKRLSEIYKLCILSNANHQLVDSSLNRAGLSKYFKVILISSDIGVRKPAKAAFNKLIDAGVDPSKSLFIDDREANRRKAEQMGFSVLEFRNKSDLLGRLADL